MKIKELTIDLYEFYVAIVASHIFGSCHSMSKYTYLKPSYSDKKSINNRGSHWPADTGYPTKIKRKHSCE